MANLWFSVLVLIFVQNAFAIECPTRDNDIKTCDQCLRCGGTWCSTPNKITGQQCWFRMNDDTCQNIERPTTIKRLQVESANSSISPVYAEQSLLIAKESRLSFSYKSSVKRNIKHTIHNTTQTNNIYVKTNEPAKCDDSKCDVDIIAIVGRDFCTSQSTDMEFIYITIQVENTTDTAMIKFHVPCACKCTKDKEPMSLQCNGNGNFTCGGCSCNPTWSGIHCDTREHCETGRGDVSCSNPMSTLNVACSGNGYCGPCDTCICYENMTGWQYFDRNNYCSDVCMDTAGCESCLTNGTLGGCQPAAHEGECASALNVIAYNKTLATTTYDNMSEWVKCNSTFKDPDCYVEYFAMRTEQGISVMVIKPCSQSNAGALVAGASGTTVPIILGVLGVLAAVAVVGGVMLWKHLNAVPAMPFSSPDYQNIDAEDCVGENPLYKPPTSTFTNPQFGKC